MLVDNTVIFVRSGKGGHGCVSFRREKYVPKGGPDGGDGGRGGDVILVGDDSLDSLLHLTRRPHYRATNGQPGQGKQKHGADGEDCLVPVPLGTVVSDDESGDFIADVSDQGQRVTVVTGGKGGFGNEHFKSSTNQTPREFTEGEPFIERRLRLELKLIADIGLVGLPNAGKSTMLRAVSRATPRVADYPFTTLQPSLGIAELPGERRLVVADIPGLIEGAADGAGLGHDFLKHIERTRALAHVLDVAPFDESDPATNYATIRRELGDYAPELASKPELIVLNKIDLIPEADRADHVRAIIEQLPADAEPVVVSGAAGENIAAMLERCWKLVEKHPASPAKWEA